MTDKEMIEEMRKDLIEIFDEEFYKRRVITPDFVSIKLKNLGYRKIPEGSVVLSKEEWKQLYNDERASYYRAENLAIDNDLLNRKLIDARKETATEILKDLYEQIDEKTPKWVETQIKMKAKQFGVEIKE